MSRLRSAVTVAGVSLALAMGATTLGTTSAAYVDTAQARAQATTEIAGLTPRVTYIAQTPTVVQDDGTIWIWGYRGSGLSGTGSDVASSAPPTAIQLPNDGYTGPGRRRAVKVVAGSDDNYALSTYAAIVALSDDGRVYTWGVSAQVTGRPGNTYQRPGQLTGIDRPVVDIVPSGGSFGALTDTGDVWTWGAAGFGHPGQGGLGADAATPLRILSGIHSLHGGVWGMWAVTTDSWRLRDSNGGWQAGAPTSGTSPTVLAWGYNDSGLGWHTGSPTSDGFTLGANATPKNSPRLTALLGDGSGCTVPGVVAGSPGDRCTLRTLTGHYYGGQVLLADGSVYSWGTNAQWGAGRSDATGSAYYTPKKIANLPPITQVAPSQDIVMMRADDGAVWMYGRFAAQFGFPDPNTGIPTTTNRYDPVRISAWGTDNAVLGAFSYTGMVIKDDGSFWVVGGGLANGNTNTHSVVRNHFGTQNTTPTATAQRLTKMVWPGLQREGQP